MGLWWSGAAKKAEEKHRAELENIKQERDREVALERKISQNRNELLKMGPGKSDYFPEDEKVPKRLLISLFGEIGTGKSSLINSLMYTIKGELSKLNRIQSASKAFQGSHSMMSREFVLTDELSVIDTPGINCGKAADDTNQRDVIKRMEGRYTKETVNWRSNDTRHGNEEDKKSYCSVLVFSAHNANVAREYRSFIHRLRDWQGYYPIAVITHVDEVSPSNVRLALESGGIVDIYAVANITSGEHGRNDVSPEHQLELLELLQKSFIDGDSIFLHRQEIARAE